MWYLRDFADSAVPELLEWITAYCDETTKSHLETLLRGNPSEITVQYSEYNWLLNKF